MANCIHDEIKSRINSRNSCSLAVQNLFSYNLLSKKVKINIYKNITLPDVLYEFETRCITPSEEYWLGCIRAGYSRKYLFLLIGGNKIV